MVPPINVKGNCIWKAIAQIGNKTKEIEEVLEKLKSQKEYIAAVSDGEWIYIYGCSLVSPGSFN